MSDLDTSMTLFPYFATKTQLLTGVTTFNLPFNLKTTKNIHLPQENSFTPLKYKIDLIRTLTYRCLRICSSTTLLQTALNDLTCDQAFVLKGRCRKKLQVINDLKNLLSRNGYPRGITTYNMNDVVTRNLNKPKDLITTVPKRDVSSFCLIWDFRVNS